MTGQGEGGAVLGEEAHADYCNGPTSTDDGWECDCGLTDRRYRRERQIRDWRKVAADAFNGVVGPQVRARFRNPHDLAAWSAMGSDGMTAALNALADEVAALVAQARADGAAEERGRWTAETEWGVRHYHGSSMYETEGSARSALYDWQRDAPGESALIRRTVLAGEWEDAS